MVKFPELVSEMVSADLKAVAEESKARDRHHD
jgi:hypothetical protein